MGTSTVIYPAPSGRETQVTFFFREKTFQVSRHLFLLLFARRIFGRRVRSDCLSSRHHTGHLARRGGRARRSSWASRVIYGSFAVSYVGFTVDHGGMRGLCRKK
jgi:hypothetical protein